MGPVLTPMLTFAALLSASPACHSLPVADPLRCDEALISRSSAEPILPQLSHPLVGVMVLSARLQAISAKS